MKVSTRTLVYLIADIHGQIDFLRTLLEAIQKDASHHPFRNVLLHYEIILTVASILIE